MAIICAGGREFDVDVVVFDKDGTLIDFHMMWGDRAVSAVEALLSELGGDAGMADALYSTLGYDRASGRTRGDGPLATAPLPKTDVVMSTVLYQNGLAWDEAETLVREVFSPVMAGEPAVDVIVPLGNVGESLARLHAGGVRTVVATTDNRASTLKILDTLGVSSYFDVIYCGDDEDLPKKPSARVLEEIAERCATVADRLMMVGDTVSDLSMAHSAKAGARIGVIGGATERTALAPWSDVLISSIDELCVSNESG